MIDLRIYTVRQILLACGLARGIKRSFLCSDIGIQDSYITKMNKDENFIRLTDSFKVLPKDPDTAKYEGLKTLMLDMARMTWNLGEKK